MEITFKHGLTYTNSGIVPVADVAESLLGNETLIRQAGELIGSLIDGLYVDQVDVKFNKAIHNSPLRELFFGTLIFTYQEELSKEVPDLIRSLTGVDVPDKYDTLLTVVVLILSFYGADYLYRRFVSDKRPAAISDNRDKLLYVAGDYFNVTQDHIRETIEETTKGVKKLSLAKATKRLFVPAKREVDAYIETDGGIIIPRTLINEVPSDIDIENEEDTTISEAYQNVKIELRAEDADRNKQGWAGVIVDIHDKRLRMEVYPTIDPAKIFGKKRIEGDIILVSKKQPNGTYKPSMFHLVKLSDDT